MSSVVLAQTQADEFYDPNEMQMARDMLKDMNGNQTSYLIFGERFEQEIFQGDTSFTMEGQGWIGKDLDKLWIKTEANYNEESHKTEEFELQALYSHAVSPFWDIQLGLRHDYTPNSSQDYAAIGIQGLAPYWFEIDFAAFISDKGDVSTRFEAEYEFRLRQRLFLQPRLEINYAQQSDPVVGFETGINNSQIGLRLRYEFQRNFAPYLGLSWKRSYGETANFLQRTGEDLSMVVGIRFWL